MRMWVALAGAVAVVSAVAGEKVSVHAVDTAASTLVIEKRDGAWSIPYFGARLGAPGDVAALGAGATRWHGDTRHPAYAAYGQPLKSMDVDKFGGLAVRHADGTVSTELVAVGDAPERVKDADGIVHVVLHHRDAVQPLFVDQHFRADVASDVIETWVEIRHEEKGPVALLRMDSLAVDLPRIARAYRVHTLSSWWGTEGRLVETDLNRSQTLTVNSRNGVRGAWDANPAFMLALDPPATEETGRVIGGVLGWSGAWRISFRRDWGDVVQICAGPDNGNGAYVLDPKKTLRTPDFAFTWSDRGRGQVSRNLHRWARTRRLPHGTALRDVLLNSWEGSYFTFTEKVLTDMMDGVAEMGGELFVLDDGWFGRGKFARDDKNRDTVGLGDWVVNPEKLPHGLTNLVAEAHKRGLKFGLWFEPEMVNSRSELYTAHPDWILRDPTRPVRFGRGGTQTVLDLANPAVTDALYAQLDAIWSVPGLDYIKWDANANIWNLGSPYLAADRQANLWFDYTAGVYGLLERLGRAHPATVVQACSSGGGHLDYGWLKYCDEAWVSDDSDARERVFMQWGALQFYPASALAAHVTASPNHQTGRTTPLKFRFDVAMSGRLGFELHPKDMKPEEVAFAKRCVADYRRLRDVVQQGDLYRLVSPYEASYASLMHVSADRSRALVFVWGLNRGPNREYPARVRLAGLDPARRYAVKEINRLPGAKAHVAADGTVVSAAALMEFGFEPVLSNGDYDSCVIELEARD